MAVVGRMAVLVLGVSEGREESVLMLKVELLEVVL